MSDDKVQCFLYDDWIDYINEMYLNTPGLVFRSNIIYAYIDRKIIGEYNECKQLGWVKYNER